MEKVVACLLTSIVIYRILKVNLQYNNLLKYKKLILLLSGIISLIIPFSILLLIYKLK